MLLDGFAEVGISEGRRPSAEVTDPVIRSAMAAAPQLGDDLLAVQRDRCRGWRYSLDLGDYGTNRFERPAQLVEEADPGGTYRVR
ncbi:hypothetical protein [Actinomadura madurae]|uniref:hypothetical protein n=1 Tax=Actinomadura madurae TaxID=1993 RepID=UPI0015A4FF12|nr:hypothetical protein [Actinomadura madurae]